MTIRTRLLAAAAVLTVGTSLVAVGLRAQAAVLTRGPYLQLGTPSSVVIRWRTATPSDSLVRYGTVPGALASTAAAAASSTEHVVTLRGLAPHTRYFYAVGSSAGMLAGGDLDHTFTTSPPAGATAPLRLWVLGDSGTADATARAVRDAYMAREAAAGTQMVVMLGDNAYQSGTDAEYQTAVFDMFGAMLRRAVVWSTFGNHDAISADSATQSGPYYDVFTLPTAGEAGGVASGTEAYYSFDYGNVHLVCLDSSESDRSATGSMATWLRADLAQSRAEWTIAFFHHAPYSKGTHDSDSEPGMKAMREQIVPILEAGGVDLVLAGHSHNYERSTLIAGHYGVASTFGPANQIDAGLGDPPYQKARGAATGAVYVTAGSSGQAGPGALDHPAMRIAYATAGSMLIEVDGPRLQAAYLRDIGVFHDGFAMTKVTDAGSPSAPWMVGLSSLGDPNVVYWRAAAGGGRVDGYRLEAGTAPDRTDIGTLVVGNVNQYRFPRTPGRYFVRVRAFNAAGLGPPSADVPIVVGGFSNDVRPPAPPTPISAVVTGSTVQLSWPRDVSGFSVDHLEIGTRPGATDLGTVVAPLGPVAASGVAPGVYFVRYRRANLAGAGPPSLDTQVVVGGAPAPPGRPGEPRAAVLGSSVAFTWAPPVDGGAVVRYVLEAGLAADTPLLQVPSTGAQPALAVAPVPSGVYYVRVRGENSAGLGVPSRETRLLVP